METFVGCSGYFYGHWQGLFYPPELPKSRWLGYYARYFRALEINATFYRFPTAQSLRHWYPGTPEGFAFAVKAPRLITHYKKFNATTELVRQFEDACATALRDKLHVLLWQLPPSLHATPAVADRLLPQLGPAFRHVIEPRHPSWWAPWVYAACRDAGVTLALVSYPGIPEELVPTAPDAYLRLHGEPERYVSDYPEPRLAGWLDALQQADPPFGNAYVFFDNDVHVKAVWNAMRTQELAVARGLQTWQPPEPWAPFPGWRGDTGSEMPRTNWP